MKSRIGQVVLSGLLISGLFTGDAPAREVRPDPPRQDHADQFHAPIAGLNQINTINRSAAGTDTTFLGSWSFDTGGICDPQGWTSVDYTEQIGAMFHVDDFSGLNGGDFGWLVPLEGNQSLWCGLRPVPDDPELCGYAALPGYGNNWDQRFRTVDCVAVDVGLTIDFLIMWDSEPGYDATQIEADACDNNWTMFAGGLGTYDSAGKGFRSHRLPDSLFAPRIRLRFRFISDGGGRTRTVCGTPTERSSSTA
jgi:hypothetical protein